MQVLSMDLAVLTYLIPVVPLAAIGMATGELEILEHIHPPIAFSLLLACIGAAAYVIRSIFILQKTQFLLLHL